MQYCNDGNNICNKKKNKFATDKMENIAYFNKKKMPYDIAFFFWEIQKK